MAKLSLKKAVGLLPSSARRPRRLRFVLGPLFRICLLIYFVFHIFQGERGLFSWLRLRQVIEADENVLSELQSQRENLERQVTLLRPDSLDLDMLEERSRVILNFARPDEVVIYNEALTSEKKKG